MRIAVFHNLPIGGAKRVLYEELKYLSENHDLFLYELENQDKNFLNLKKLVKETKEYKFYISSKLPSFFKRLQSDYKNFVSLKKLHKQIAYDINNGNYDAVLVHPDKFTQAPFLLRFLKIPSIYYCEEWLRIVYEDELDLKDQVNIFKKKYELLTRLIRKNIDRKNAKKATAVLTNSSFTKRNIDKAYGINSKVCYLGVDSDVFKPLGKSKKNQILFVGAPVEENGYKLLEKALDLLDVKTRQSVKVVNLFDGVRRIKDEELVREYSKSFASVSLAFLEPFGLVCLESMACKTPVIALKEGGYCETVRDGETGFLIGRESGQLASKINQLKENSKLVEKLGKKGREDILKNWTWEKHMKILEEEMKKLRKRYE